MAGGFLLETATQPKPEFPLSRFPRTLYCCSGVSSAHTSRTMMIAELTLVLNGEGRLRLRATVSTKHAMDALSAQ
jgi:hypothetical protein